MSDAHSFSSTLWIAASAVVCVAGCPAADERFGKDPNEAEMRFDLCAADGGACEQTRCTSDAGDDAACAEDECDALTALPPLQVSLPRGTGVGSVARYECEVGYELSGDEARTCQPDGHWSGSEPTCRKPGECPTPEAPNDGSVATPNGTAPGAVANYVCDADHELSGDSTRTCQSDGQWSGEKPSCAKPGSCPSPDAPTDGSVATPDGTQYGAEAHYACDADHELSGDQTRTCLPDGEWSGGEPTCTKRGDCPAPEAPNDGSVSTPNGTGPGAVANYACDADHELSGDSTRTCQSDGQWSGEKPGCAKPGNCPSPDAPSDGSVATPDGTQYGSSAHYACDAGYELSGGDTRSCVAGGTWSGAEPTCEPVDCMTPPVPNNGSAAAPNGTHYGQIAQYSCSTSYVLVGASSRTCEASASWSGSTPACLRDCGNPVAPTHGTASAPSGTLEGSQASYDCAPGYTVSGGSSATCQANGAWSGTHSCPETDGCAGTTVCIAEYPCLDRAPPSDSYICRGQFAEWTPSDSPSSFTDNGDGTVTDGRNGLVWQRAVSANTYQWEPANTYCADLTLAGGGFRLPTKAELESIVDFALAIPSIDPQIFPNTPASRFWTVSTDARTPQIAWYVSFDEGGASNLYLDESLYVRCVR